MQNSWATPSVCVLFPGLEISLKAAKVWGAVKDNRSRFFSKKVWPPLCEHMHYCKDDIFRNRLTDLCTHMKIKPNIYTPPPCFSVFDVVLLNEAFSPCSCFDPLTAEVPSSTPIYWVFIGNHTKLLRSFQLLKDVSRLLFLRMDLKKLLIFNICGENYAVATE